MATLYVTEYSGQGAAYLGSSVAAPQEPAILQQSVTIGAGSLQTRSFSPQTRLIRVHTDAICSIAVGADPTAAATGQRMAAGQTEYYCVYPGHKVAVITNS